MIPRTPGGDAMIPRTPRGDAMIPRTPRDAVLASPEDCDPKPLGAAAA